MDFATPATFAILTLLSIGGLYYLRRFFSERPVVVPTTGPLAGGFGRIELGASIFLIVFFTENTVKSFGQKQVFSVPIIVASCVLYLAFIIGLISLLIIRYRNPINVLGLRWTRWRREIPLAILALLSIYPLIILVQLIAQAIVQKYFPEITAPQEIVIFLANSPGLQERLLLILLAVIMAPLAEETIFRGFMFGTIRQYWGRWPALIISASVFALIHGHIPALPGLFILAIFLSLVYERTGSLWAPIMLHAIFNAVTVVGTIFFPSSMS